MMKEEFKLLAKELKIQEDLVETYLALIYLSPATVGEISVVFNIDNQEAQDKLAILLKKRMVIKHPGIVDRYSSLPPFKGFQDILRKYQKSILEFEKSLKVKVEGQEKKIKNIFDSNREEVKNSSDLLEKNILVSKEKLSDSITKYIEDNSLRTKKISDDIEKNLVFALSKQYELIKQETEKTQLKAKENVKKFISILKENNDLSKKELFTVIEERILPFIESLKEKQTNLSVNDENLVTKIKDMKKEFVRKDNVRYKNIKQNLADIFSSLEEELNLKQNQVSEEITSSTNIILKDMNVDFKSILDTLKQSMIEDNKNLIEKVDHFTSSSESQNEKTHASLIKNLGKIESVAKGITGDSEENYTNAIKTFKTMSEGYSKEIGLKIRSASKINISNLESVFSDFSDSLRGILESLGLINEENMDLAKKALDKTCENFVNSYSSLITSLKKDIIKNLSTVVLDYNTKLEDFKAHSSKLITSSRNSAKKVIKQYNQEMLNTLNESKDKIHGLGSTIKIQIQNVLENQRADVDQHINKIQNITKKSANLAANEIETSVNSLKGSLNEEFDIQVSHIANVELEIKSKLKELVEKKLGEVRDDVNLWETEARESTKIITDQFLELMKNIEEDMVTRLSGKQIEISDKLLELKNNFKKEISAGVSTFSDRADVMKSGLDTLVEVTGEAITTDVKGATSKIHSVLKTLKKGLVEGFSNISQTVNSEIDISLVEITSDLETTGSNLSLRTNEATDEISKNLSNLKRKINQVVTNNIKIIGESVNSTNVQISTILNKTLTQNKGVLETSLKTPVSNLLDKTSKQFNIISSKIEDELIYRLKGRSIELSKEIQSFAELFEQITDQEFLSFFNNLESEQVEFLNNIKEKVSNFEKIKISAENEIIKTMQSNREKIARLNGEQVTSLTKILDDQKSSLNQMNATGVKSIRNGLKISKNATSEKMKNNVKFILASLQANFQSLSDSVKDYMLSIDNLLTPLMAELLETQYQAVLSVTDIINKQVDQNKQFMEDTRSLVDDNYVDIIKNLEDNTTEQQEEMFSSINSLLDKSEQKISITENQLHQKKGKYDDAILKLIENLNQNTKKTLLDFSEQNISGIKQFEKGFLNNISEFETESIPIFLKIKEDMRETVDKINDKSNNLISVLGSAWDLLLDRKKLLTLKSWVISNKESLFSYIAGAMKRTKTSIFIAVPKLSDLSLKTLLKIPVNIDVIIITATMDKNNPEITKVINKPHIRIFKNPNQTTIAVMRDNEETLFAQSTSQAEEFVGLVSGLEESVKYFNEVFGLYLMRDSKEFKSQ
ncbi:MAG: hypothetical protein ACTSUV_04695 [Candidatus Ranarchaeia archaeon]